MFTLSTFLDRYRKLEPPQASIKKLLVQAIRDECGITLEERSVRLENGGAFIACHPSVKSEVTLCAPRILTYLRERSAIRLAFIR